MIRYQEYKGMINDCSSHGITNSIPYQIQLLSSSFREKLSWSIYSSHGWLLGFLRGQVSQNTWTQIYYQTDTIRGYKVWRFVRNCTLTLEYLYQLCDSWQASFVGYQDSHMQWDSWLEHRAIHKSIKAKRQDMFVLEWGIQTMREMHHVWFNQNITKIIYQARS